MRPSDKADVQDTERNADGRDQRKEAVDLDFPPAAHLKGVVDRRHFEDTLAVGQFEINTLDDHRHGIPDVNDAEKEHQFRPVHDERQRRDQAAEKHAARVAHEHPGRIKVPDQEPGAGARRGAGESKLEYDRRHVRRRIDALRERLEELERRRAETRKSREKSGVPVVALVGYTNVGKSSLLNRLCGAQVLEADMLFATLDPTARRLTLPSGLACVAVDTVGFVSRLPHNLVQAFKSTLEEAAFADVILKVCDASDPEAAAQLAVTDDVLGELGCGDIPQIVVYNKCDRVENAALFDTLAVRTSAVTGEGLDALLARLDAALAGRVRRIAVLLPYDKLGEATPMRENGTVLTEEYRPEGVYLEGIVKTMDLHRFTPYLV